MILLLTSIHLLYHPCIHATTSLAYSKCFYAAKMTTIDRLAKKIGKEPGFLLSLEVDEDDAEDIVQVGQQMMMGLHTMLT